uniref:Nudix hydrolase domain-containing protein n=1 Tax=viral metagenome TaxID=1070528 RepID=A0A6C0M184_9ZZZZ
MLRSCIASYGLIVHSYKPPVGGSFVDSEPYFLLAKRRDTMEYSDYIKGMYSDADLEKLVSLMSDEERTRIRTHNFVNLWNDMCVTTLEENCMSSIVRSIYQRARDKFESSKNIVLSLIASSKSSTIEPQWGFPKGRRSRYEDNFTTAMREFEEETNIDLWGEGMRMWNFPPFIEIFYGTCGKYYSSKYYIAELPYPVNPNLIELPNNIRKLTVSNEVSEVVWLHLNEACELLCERRSNMLRSVNATIKRVNSMAI